MFKLSGMGVFLLTLLTNAALATDLTSTTGGKSGLTPIRVIVMPYKLVGNVDVKTDNEHQQRLTFADIELRKGLSASQHYDLVDETASQDFSKKVIEALGNNNCNKCESAWAKELNAKQIVVPWVYRLSQLVLTMHFDVIDTDSGKIILKKSLDFRGDNDQSWQRAIQYFLENIKKP